MPELPEVETIIRDLKKFLPGLKIKDIWTDIKRFKKLKKTVLNKKILDVQRKGKNVLINLSNNLTLLIHQKMTGHLMYGKWQFKNKIWKSVLPGPMADDPQNRFIHLIFFLSNNYQLALSDMRKFAKALISPTNKLESLIDLAVGPDPMDKNFNFKKFKEILNNKNGKIKQTLMDQKIISGIGNIYSDEILWLARIHPLKKTNKLSEKEFKKLYQSIKLILKRAILARGTSSMDYRDALGRKGKYQNMKYAYGLEGQNCQKKDGGKIKRIKIGGRSAHFCPVHQKI
jgi:formamidopyrimidine-DNA glycosylase